MTITGRRCQGCALLVARAIEPAVEATCGLCGMKPRRVDRGLQDTFCINVTKEGDKAHASTTHSYADLTR